MIENILLQVGGKETEPPGQSIDQSHMEAFLIYLPVTGN